MKNRKIALLGKGILFFLLPLSFLLVACPPNDEPNESPFRYAHLTILGDSQVTVSRDQLDVDKGSTWSQLKEEAVNAVFFATGYELKEWRFDNADGDLIPDDFSFSENKVLFAVTAASLFLINEEGCITGANVAVSELPSDLIFPVKIGKMLVKKIATNAFKGCTTVVRIDFSAATHLEEIGDFAFEGGSALKSINFPLSSKLSTIGQYAFQNCSSLENCNLSACPNLKMIDSGAFERCSELKSPDFSTLKNLEYVGRNAFRWCSGSSFSEVDLSACTKLKSLASGVFDYCLSLERVVLPTSLEKFEEGTTALGVFSNCSNLKNIDLSYCSELTSIGRSTFYGCGELVTMDLSSCTKLTNIGETAFSFCSKAKVKLPASIKTLGAGAFGTNPGDFCSKVIVPAALKSLVIDTGYRESTIQVY